MWNSQAKAVSGTGQVNAKDSPGLKDVTHAFGCPSLWVKIRGWHLPHRSEWDTEAESSRLCDRFEHNLRKNGDWTDASADRITAIYRWPLYLKELSGGDVPASTFIDAARHWEPEFPDNYAALCQSIGRDIPHRTKLTYAECQKAHGYGLAVYAKEFDQPVDRDL